jgi:hypothetical protein
VQHDVVKSKKLKPMSNLKNVVILVRFFIILYLWFKSIYIASRLVFEVVPDLS